MIKITVNEEYQTGYTYRLKEPVGKNLDPEFKPDLTPKDMLQLGIFGGDYFSKVPSEFPSDWFEGVELSESGTADKNLNFFKLNASQPIKEWRRKGWIYEEDPKGWFLWYCRYYLGRRIPEEDKRQIKRWKNMRRHVVQIEKNCKSGDFRCHTKQRQALLHWAYDSRKI
jgi:hypothetical protein